MQELLCTGVSLRYDTRMAEKPRMFTKGRAITGGVLAAVLSLSGAGVWRYANPPASEIVSGVAGQVEGKRTADGGCDAYAGPTTCATRAYKYYIRMEQCPEDVEAARRGEQTASFDAGVGQYAGSCVVDEFVADHAAFQEAHVGDTYTPSGPVGGELPAS